jgi:hypothetical protein
MASKIKGRTVREFQSSADVWGILDAWAAQTGYNLLEQDQASRTYNRGTGFWIFPQRLMMAYTGQGYRMETWVICSGLNRIVTLGLMPPELRVEKGGFAAVIPRDKAREQVNQLMQALGQPPIS